MSLTLLVEEFLADLKQANHSPHTLRAYATDLAPFTYYHKDTPEAISVESLRQFWKTTAHLAPTTRARKQACIARFLTWAYQKDFLTANPMDRIDRVKCEPPLPRGLRREKVEAVLAVIPAEQKRDRLLLRLLFETGMRVSEVLALHLEDLDLTADDERLRVLGKGNKPRTVLLDDPKLVRQIRAYIKEGGLRHGPLFRAKKNGNGGPLRYQSIQERWSAYCKKAGVVCTLHQLRHTHATELVNEGVSLATIRKRLGHKNLQTTLRYAEQSDQSADAEMRAWRRRKIGAK